MYAGVRILTAYGRSKHSLGVYDGGFGNICDIHAGLILVDFHVASILDAFPKLHIDHKICR